MGVRTTRKERCQMSLNVSVFILAIAVILLVIDQMITTHTLTELEFRQQLLQQQLDQLLEEPSE